MVMTARRTLQIEATVRDNASPSLRRIGEALDQVSAKQTKLTLKNSSAPLAIVTDLQSTAKALSDLNVAAIGSSGFATVLQLGKAAQDFRELRQAAGQTTETFERVTRDALGVATGVEKVTVATGKSAGVWSTLKAVMVAHPILTIASVVGAAAAAVGTFASSWSKLTEEIDKMGASFDRLRLEERTARILGLDPASAVEARAAQIRQNLAQLLDQALTVEQVVKSLDVSKTDVLRFLARSGNADAQTYVSSGRLTRTQNIGSPLSNLGQTTVESPVDPGTLPVDPQQVQQIARLRFEALRREAEAAREAARENQQVAKTWQESSASVDTYVESLLMAAAAHRNFVANNATDMDKYWNGFQNGANAALERWRDFNAAGREAAATLVDSGLSGLSNAFAEIVTGTKSAKEAFRDYARNMLVQLAQIIARLLIMRALGLASPVPAQENGGVLPGNVSSTVPLRQFARGGVVHRPTLALFGEGRASRGEAFVPLPDGRHIPVALAGGGGGQQVNVTIQAWDGTDVARVLSENRGLLRAFWMDDAQRLRSVRQVVQGAAR